MPRPIHDAIGCWLLLCLHLSALAQTSPFQVDLPKLVPPSPDVASLIKAGVGNANLSSGAATAEIPLYTLRIKDFTLPISLSYSTQGMKVTEASSRVGYGWTLNANGVVSRSVRDKPDEFAKRADIPASFDINNSNTALYNYLINVTQPNQAGDDTQADEFQFNVNGLSGKFVLQKVSSSQYAARVTAIGNILVDVTMTVPTTSGSTSGSISRIVITGTDGVKYYFGGTSGNEAFEITTNISNAKYDAWKNILRTAFFLDRIDLPTGEYITFTYSPVVNIDVITGLSQSTSVSTAQGTDECTACGSYNSHTAVTTDKVWYNTRYLTGITTSTGVQLNFTYSSGGTKLNTFEVVGVKQYQFGYSSGTRFFLTDVKDVTLGTDKPVSYVLTYDRLSSVPSLTSTKQDFLGFYRTGAAGDLIPSANTMGDIDFGFRRPDADAAMIGTLKTITYPTGGTEEFFYEGNSVVKNPSEPTTVPRSNFSLSKEGQSGGPVTYQDSVRLLTSQTVTLTYNAGDIFDDNIAGLAPGDTATTMRASVCDSTGTIVAGPYIMHNYAGGAAVSVSLTAFRKYIIKLTIYRASDFSYVTFSYADPSLPVPAVPHVAVPGVRLRRIKLTDPITGGTTNKWFTYARLSDLTRSSGGGPTVENFQTFEYKRHFCAPAPIEGGGSGIPSMDSECTLRMYSNSTAGEVYDYSTSGSYIYYPAVIESDDPDFVNGGTQYEFYDNDNGQFIAPVLTPNSSSPYTYGGHAPTLTGRIKKKSVFNSSKVVIREEETQYNSTNGYPPIIDNTNMPVGVSVRKNWDPESGTLDLSNKLTAFDATKIYYNQVWYREEKVIVKDYTGGVTKQNVTVYTYGTRDNILPASLTVTNNFGDSLRTELKYSNTYTPVLATGYDLLSAKNIIAPVVSQTLYKNGVLQQQKRTLYNYWNGNVNNVQPEKIQLRKSATDVLQDVIVYTSYSTAGNPTGVKKANDVPIAYLWDEQYSLPVCEVKGALPAQIAYSSFETSTLGNWTIISGSTNTTGAFNGTHRFSGELNKSISIGGDYEVTLWSTNTDAQVIYGTVTASRTQLATYGGWRLYRWTFPIASTTTVKVTGTNIDEVRLKPVAAIMQTYVHKPFIGVTAIVDANNKLTTFEYDSLGRLLTVRDEKNNILKNHQYHYLTNN